MKVKIYANTPLDSGVFVTSVERTSLDDVIFELQMTCRTWDFFYWLPLTNDKAIGRHNFSTHEPEPSQGRCAGESRDRQRGCRTALLLRPGAQQAQPEVPSQAVLPNPDQSFGADQAGQPAE